MGPLARGVAAGIVVALGLLGGAAQAATATTTTTSTSTTSTTLLPHPYSPATAACVKAARRAYTQCQEPAATCGTTFQTAFANCFAPPAGVKCASSAIKKRTSCLAAAPVTRKTCRNGCANSRKADKKACRLIAADDAIWAGGDGACFATAEANFALCRFTCAEAETDCFTNFTFAIADCPNL